MNTYKGPDLGYGVGVKHYHAKLREASTFPECWQVYRECCGKRAYEKVAIGALKKASLNATTTSQFIYVFNETEDPKLQHICLRGARRVSETKKDIDMVTELVRETEFKRDLDLCKIKAVSIKRQLILKKIREQPALAA